MRMGERMPPYRAVAANYAGASCLALGAVDAVRGERLAAGRTLAPRALRVRSLGGGALAAGRTRPLPEGWCLSEAMVPVPLVWSSVLCVQRCAGVRCTRAVRVCVLESRVSLRVLRARRRVLCAVLCCAPCLCSCEAQPWLGGLRGGLRRAAGGRAPA